jgi:hypothetical protein
MDVFPRAELERVITRSSLPGINPEERRVLQEYLRRHGAEFEELRFNVRVGLGIRLEGDYTDKFRFDWEERTKMRPDCVGWSPPKLATLIEAKTLWTNHAVWQLLSYRDAYAGDNPDAVIDLVGVAEAYTPQALSLSTSQGIRVYVYSFPPEAPLAPATSEIRS